MTDRNDIATPEKDILAKVPSIRVVDAIVMVIATILSLMLLQTTVHATATNSALQDSTVQYVECSEATYRFKAASDSLTSCARRFTVTTEIDAVHDFFNEVNNERRRDAAIEVLEQHVEDREAERYLSVALAESNTLAEREQHAMRLAAQSKGYELTGDLAPLASVSLTEYELSLSPEEQLSLAQDLVYGTEYQDMKDSIDSNVELCTLQLIESTHSAQEANAVLLQSLLVRQRILTILLLAMVVLSILVALVLVLLPLAAYSKSIAEGQPLEESGSQELRLLAREYNKLFEETRLRHDLLRHKADHDPLTGLYNRGAFNDLCKSNPSNIALVLVDVDYFKKVNDTYGHEVGDKILKKVAGALSSAFRSTDLPCRIGGDEFAVIVTNVSPSLKNVIVEKINQIVKDLFDDSDGLPKTTLSIGVAFSDALEPEETLYKAADRALYLAKERGRDCYAFSDDPALVATDAEPLA